MGEKKSDQVDLRGHHLFTLSNLYFLHGRHELDPVVDRLRTFRLGLQGYDGAKDLNAHIRHVIGRIVDDRNLQVRIVADHDLMCEGCRQRRDDHCEIWGRRYSADFLEMADRAVIENTGDVLEVGGVYPSGYILDNIWKIRVAIMKTAIDIPGLIRFA